MARTKQDDDLFLDDLGDNFLDDDSSSGGSSGGDEDKKDDFLEDVDNVPGQLAVDVYQTKEDVVVVAPVPGVSKENIDISLVENTLTIRGTRSSSHTVSEGDFFAQELHWGEFSRSIILPAQVKEEAEAVLKDGMLTVRLPKAEQDKIKKISIS